MSCCVIRHKVQRFLMTSYPIAYLLPRNVEFRSDKNESAGGTEHASTVVQSLQPTSQVTGRREEGKKGRNSHERETVGRFDCTRGDPLSSKLVLPELVG